MTPEQFQKKVEADQQQKNDAQSEQSKVDAVKQSVDNVTLAVNNTTKGLSSVKGQVKVTNPDLAKSGDVNSAIEAINELNLTTFMTANGSLSEITDNLSNLASNMAQLHDKFRASGLDSVNKQLTPLVTRLEQVSKQLGGVKLEVDSKVLKSVTDAFKNLDSTISSIDWKPQINVPKTDVRVPAVNLQPLIGPLGEVVDAVKAIDIPETNVDFSGLSGDIKGVQKSIDSLRFPVSNFELPFKDEQGKAAQLQLDSQGRITTLAAQANNAGKTIVSKAGSVASSGDNTLIAAGTNKLKVFRLKLTTVSTTALTVKITDGASGAVLDQALLQAPASVTVGSTEAVPPPAFLFATSNATALIMNLSSANTVHYSLSYYDEA